jgi:hypothetical protein
MADGVAITAGTGTTVATDDCGASGHAQLFKLAYSTDGAATLVAADVEGLRVNQSRASTATLANVAAATSSTTLQASNAARRALEIFNDSTSILYVKYGAAASSTSFTHRLQAGESVRETIYTGIVTGIWVSADGNARMTELTV